MSIEFAAEDLTSQKPQVCDIQEQNLRPKTLSEYIGQSKHKEHLSVYLQAAKQRNEPLDHILLHGPPGLGKTTLAGVITHEMGVNLRTTSGPAIEKPGDLAALLSNLTDGDILFIDEIHRLDKSVEEILYPAMEDHVIDIMIGKGPSSDSVRLGLPPFTLIGATTRSGKLSAPLRDRFGITMRLELYTPEELSQIVTRSAGVLGIAIDESGAMEIARRSRGTPRIANRLLKRVRDFVQIWEGERINSENANKALTALEIDAQGLNRTDLIVLQTIRDVYGGGPVGLDTLASTIGEEAVTLEDVCEPFLLARGFLARTPRGRCITESGKTYIA